MIHSKKVVCVIPARLKSTRFPRKMLALLKGRPLLQWAWDSAKRVPLFDDVVFAIDAEETARVIESFHGRYIMTSEYCPSGTDRLVELMQRGVIDADIWVNWQGDEPFIHGKMIQDLLQTADTDQSDVWTLKKRIVNAHEIQSPHIAKVVCDHQGFALYFSRSVIPYYRDVSPGEQKVFFKHVGMYAFTKAALQKISSLKPCDIELAEQLEQLRFLYHNLKVQVHETSHEVFGIDLPEHLALAESFIEQNKVS